MSKANRRDLPNIVMIICHDLGQHLGCYGADIHTPNLDQLAADGVRLENYFCTAAQCSPSRGSIITGKYPHNNGLIGLAHIGWELNEDEQTLPMYLNREGYETHLFGVQHEASDPDRLGYDVIHKTDNSAARTSKEFIDFLEQVSQQEMKQGEQKQPFYASVGFFEPHRPFNREGYDNDDPEDVESLPYLPDKPGIREDIAGLNGMVYRVDEVVGNIRKLLEETGLAENTLFLFTTDHGIAMPRAKGTCYDPGLETALLMYQPHVFSDGRVYHELLSNVDLMPTLLDYIDGEIPQEIDGYSFLPLLKDKEYQERESIFVEMTWHDKYNPMRGMRTNKYKYIRNFGERPLVYLPADIYTGAAGREVKYEYYAGDRPGEELYDLDSDPLEKHNLADNPDYKDILQDLRVQVQEWMEETEDPLLDGYVPPTEKQEQRLEEDDVPN